MRARTRKLVRRANRNNEEEMSVACCNENSFKATLKLFLKSYCAACAGRVQMNCACNYLKREKLRAVKEHLQHLKELVNVANETPNNARHIEAFEITKCSSV